MAQNLIAQSVNTLCNTLLQCTPIELNRT